MCTKRTTADLCVIGGGAAGMLASAVAAESGMRVILFEAGKDTGRKLRITGKGRCNLTNNCSPRQVIENIPTNGKFMFGAVNRLTPADTMQLF